MNITALLKSWLIENTDATKESSDDDFRKAAADSLANGALTAAKFSELIADPIEGEANEFSKKLDTIADSLSKLTEVLTKQAVQTESKKVETENKAVETEVANPPKLDKAVQTAIATGGEPVPTDKSVDVRVKGAHEQYDTTKTALKYPSQTKLGTPHALAGEPVVDFSERGRRLDSSSELDKAVVGAFAKFAIQRTRLNGSRSFAFDSLNQHEKELLQYASSKMQWVGSSDGGNEDDIYSGSSRGLLNELQQKQLFDEAAGSQGQEAVPIVFDDQVIQTPLLHGELFPLVNVVPIERGRRIEGVSTGTVTGGAGVGGSNGFSGGIDATAITLFTTTAYVAAFDTTIVRWQGAFQIGLDFMSDSPIDFGSHVTAQYGERLLEDLDDVIAAGTGAPNQPSGVIGSIGTTVTFSNTISLSNMESLRFAIPKNEHRPNLMNTIVFCSNEDNYQRVKAIPVGASDDRRIFAGVSTTAGTYDDYAIMSRAYKINESLTDRQMFYAVLGRYRMYRRRGLTFRTSTEGDTLIRNNELLITCTARYGGQIERGAAAAGTTDAQP